MNKFCTSCGAALEEGQRFCGKCGAPAQGTPAEGQGTAGVSNDLANIGAIVSTKQYKMYLFAILLGYFGVHCFSTGKKKRGMLELVLWLISAAFTMMAFLSASQSYDIDSEPIYLLFFGISLVVFALFCVFWIPDIFHIVKGTFANEPDKVPGFINALLPEWQFTKRHLVVIAVLAGIEVLGLLGGKMGFPVFLRMLLYTPSLLYSIFFGPLLGAIITGLIRLLIMLLSGLMYFKLSNLFIPCIAAFISGYIVYGISKIRFAKMDFSGNKIMQGVLIGVALFAGRTIASILAYKRITGGIFFPGILLQYPIAGVIGALLPSVLAKKGLFLGPFVKEKETV